MNASPTDPLWLHAVTTQMDADDLLRTLLGEMAQKAASISRPFEDVIRSWEIDRLLLRYAGPFAWGADPVAAVRAASRTVPLDTVLDEWSLDLTAVWWVLETPLPLQTLTDATVPVHAILAGWVADAAQPLTSVIQETDTARYGYLRLDRPGAQPGLTRRRRLHVSLWVEEPDPTVQGVSRLIPTQMFSWLEGETVQQMLTRTATMHEARYTGSSDPLIGVDTFLATAQATAQFLLAGLSWLTEKVLVEAVTPLPSHRRKQDTRQLHALDAAKVIQLRRIARHAEPTPMDGDHAGRVYSCQWEVDGYWRQQPCGPKWSKRTLRWIAAHLAGPSDQPLRVPKWKAYEVSR